MMIKIIIICFSLTAMSDLFAQTAWYESLKPEDNATVEKIIKRVERRDANAFTDASRMEARVAVPFLYFQYIHRRGTVETRETLEPAKFALKKVKGAARYLEGLLERRHAREAAIIDGFQEDDIWEALGSLGGMESAAVVAPYLFRPGPDYGSPRPGDDVAPMVYSSRAAYELSQMNLPNAPVTDDPNPDVAKWRKWAVAHKLVSPEMVAAAPTVTPTPLPTKIPRLKPSLQ